MRFYEVCPEMACKQKVGFCLQFVRLEVRLSLLPVVCGRRDAVGFFVEADEVWQVAEAAMVRYLHELDARVAV